MGATEAGEAFFEKFKDRHLVSKDAVQAMLILEGYGEDGTETLMDRIRLISEMTDTEIIKKVSELHYYEGEPDISDLGKMVAIRERTISGVLTDFLDLGRNDNYVVAIDGKIYKMDGWDLIIVDEPSKYLENEPEVNPAPEGMDLVERIEKSGECATVYLVKGLAFCSHLTYEDSLDSNIPSLRKYEDRGYNAFMVEEPDLRHADPIVPGPVNMNWIKQLEVIHTTPSRCTHVEFKNGAHLCSTQMHQTLDHIDAPSLREN